jgi:hypothetical protein
MEQRKVIFTKMNGTNGDIINAIHKALPSSIAQAKEVSTLLKDKSELETCRNIFNFVLYKIRYLADQGDQIIKTPSALMREKSGDCKSISLFIASCLSNLKIPFKFTYASYSDNTTPSHVYITTQSGIIIDPVYKSFNREKKPTYKYFKKP